MNREPILEKPAPPSGLSPITTVAELLEWQQRLQEKLCPMGQHALPELREVWFRGVSAARFSLAPGVCRDSITSWAKRAPDEWLYSPLPSGMDKGDPHDLVEYKRLNFERQMMLEFERECGTLMKYDSEQELYFLAQHYGMPTRLLDWSTNPLVALFMAIFSDNGSDTSEAGVVYAMNPTQHLPKQSRFIRDQHHPEVRKAIEIVTMWKLDKYPKSAFILPVRPHTLAGRIERQSSRFTLHCFGAGPAKNATLESRSVSPESKAQLRDQLERLNINQFTVYHTLDRLVRRIRERFVSRLMR
jgi:hypothetical protein